MKSRWISVAQRAEEPPARHCDRKSAKIETSTIWFRNQLKAHLSNSEINPVGPRQNPLACCRCLLEGYGVGFGSRFHWWAYRWSRSGAAKTASNDFTSAT